MAATAGVAVTVAAAYLFLTAGSVIVLAVGAFMPRLYRH